jgi:hypothetical protein
VLGPETPLAWWAFGPPCGTVYLPLLPAGDLPPALAGGGDLDTRLTRLAAVISDPALRGRARTALEGLQALFDGEAAEFLVEVAAAARQDRDGLRRQATLFMLHIWEEFTEVTDGLIASVPARPGLAVKS